MSREAPLPQAVARKRLGVFAEVPEGVRPLSGDESCPRERNIFRGSQWKIFLHHTCEFGKISVVGLWSLSSAHWNVPALEGCLFWRAAPSCGRAFAAESRGPWAVNPTCTHTAEGRLHSTTAPGLRFCSVRERSAQVFWRNARRKEAPPLHITSQHPMTQHRGRRRKV